MEDFIVSLPRNLSLKTISELKVKILKHIKPSQGLERPVEWFNNGRIDLKHFVPLKTIHGKNIFVIDDNDKIFIWFPHGGGLKLTHVNRFVDQEKLFETIGLLWGDGSTEGVRSLRFTNSESSSVNCVIDLFESIGIDRKIWKGQIIWSGPEEPNGAIKEECKNVWSKVLGIPKENMKSVLWCKGKSNRVKFGTIRIFIDNVILFEILIKGVLNSCINKIDELDKKTLECMVRGISYAEGCMTFCNGVVRTVSVSFDPHSDEEILFRKIFHRLGISTLPTHNNNCEFSIEGWDNFLKLFLMDIFKLDEKKNNLFIKGFLNHKFTKSRVDKLILIDKGLKQYEIVKKLNLSRQSIWSMSNKLLENNLLLKSKNNFELTSLSKDLISKIKSIPFQDFFSNR